MANEKNTTLSLKSSDGKEFTVERSVAIQSQTIKNYLDEENCTLTMIPLFNVDGPTLSKILEYCKKHAYDGHKADSNEELKKFDAKFVKVDGLDYLTKITLAANYLDIKDLLDILCNEFADRIKDKSDEEFREIFNIENDFTPEEEEKVRKEHAWAFE